MPKGRGGGPPARLEKLAIHDIGPKGDGIARGRHGTIFVDRALPGDEIEASVFRGDDDVMRGSIERILHPSPHRASPECPLYDRCGGCSLQHADDEFYFNFKIDIIANALQRAGVRTHFLDPIFCPPNTRRRATFAAFAQNRKLVMGYYRRRSHQIVPIDACMVIHDDILIWRDKLMPFLTTVIKGSKPCDVFIQIVDGAAELVITGAIGRAGRPDIEVREAAAQALRDTGIARIAWRYRWMDQPEILVQGRPLLAKFGSLSVPLPPSAFLQPTVDGQIALTDAVLNFLPPMKPNAPVADLFCGCGTFTGPLLETGARVDAFDIGGVDALAKAKGAHALKAIHRDLFEHPLRRDELNRYDVVVFDPPRAGCKEQAQELARSKVRHTIGVSCNPASFARDARILIDGGFRLEAVQIVDQFVFSHHVELVGKFSR